MVKSMLLVPTLFLKVVLQLSSFRMNSCLLVINSSRILALVLVSLSCHKMDLALQSDAIRIVVTVEVVVVVVVIVFVVVVAVVEVVAVVVVVVFVVVAVVVVSVVVVEAVVEVVVVVVVVFLVVAVVVVVVVVVVFVVVVAVVEVVVVVVAVVVEVAVVVAVVVVVVVVVVAAVTKYPPVPVQTRVLCEFSFASRSFVQQCTVTHVPDHISSPRAQNYYLYLEQQRSFIKS